jgi:hypothetical protein
MFAPNANGLTLVGVRARVGLLELGLDAIHSSMPDMFEGPDTLNGLIAGVGIRTSMF